MQQGNITSINWNAGNFFSGYVKDGDIYTYTGELIGVNLAKYQEVEQGLAKCKNKLIELGVIKIPKTPDEIIKEQSEMLEKQGQALNQTLEMCQQMKQQIEVMQNGRKSNTRINEFPAQEPEGQGEAESEQGSPDGRPITNKDKGGRNKRPAKSKKE
jgi:hypothetical protein